MARTKTRKDKTCAHCGAAFIVPTGNAYKRQHCDEHYPMWRKAVTFLSMAKNRARAKRIPFDLTTQWLFEKMVQPCPRTGLPFTFSGDGRGYDDRAPTAPSMDKVDPSGGYTMDNVQVVAWWYNCAKQRFTDAQVFDLCRRVVEHGSGNR